jgi:hypothetical protein
LVKALPPTAIKPNHNELHFLQHRFVGVVPAVGLACVLGQGMVVGDDTGSRIRSDASHKEIAIDPI